MVVLGLARSTARAFSVNVETRLAFDQQGWLMYSCVIISAGQGQKIFGGPGTSSVQHVNQSGFRWTTSGHGPLTVSGRLPASHSKMVPAGDSRLYTVASEAQHLL